MEILVVDIVDAFLNSRTQKEERAYAIFTSEEHYYAYRRAPFRPGFGAPSSGEGWRPSSEDQHKQFQKPSGLAMHICVDGPIPAAAGSKRTRTSSLARGILMWLTLDVGLDWPKAS